MIAAALFYYAPAIIAPRLAALGIVLLASHRLVPDQFGYFTLVLLVGEMLEVTASNWIRIGLLRLDSARPKSWPAAISRSGRLTLASTFIAVVGGGVAALLLVPPGQWLPFAGATAGYIVANAFLRLGLTALQLRDRRLGYAVIEGVRAALMFVAVAALLHIGVSSYGVLVWATAAVTGAGALLALAYCEFRFSTPTAAHDREDLFDRLKFGVPIVALTLLAYAVTSTDRLALQLLLGPAQVGVYAAAYALARQPLDVLATALNQGAFPELVRRFERDGDEAASRLSGSLLSVYVLVLGSGAVALSCLARPFAALLLPESYVPAATVLMPLIAGAAVLLNLKNFVFDNIFHLKRRNWLQCLSFAPGAVVAVVGCLLLVPTLRGQGAAIAMLLGAMAGLVGSFVIGRKLLRVAFEGFEVTKGLAVAAATGAAAYMAARLAPGGPLMELAAGAGGGVLGGGLLILILQPKAVADFLPDRLKIRTRAHRR